MNFQERVEKLTEWLKHSKKIVVFTGAGISTASGIPDFRSENGLYKKKGNSNPEEILSHHYFMFHPESFYQFLKKEMLYPNAKPNLAHLWIAELEKLYDVTVITQNIDSLHQKAGSHKVLELHGNIHEYICMKCGKKYSEEVLKVELPTCECKGLIRPNVVLYEEPLDDEILNEAIFTILRADMVIVIGSSLVVQPAAHLLSYYQGDKFVIMNRDETNYDTFANLIFHEDIIKIIKELKKDRIL